MKTINSTKTIIRAFVFIAFLLPPLLSNSQISYDHDIKLPAEEYGGSGPRDIIYADTKIYVYTYKRIIIFNAAKQYLGKIDFSSPPSLGRFAPRFSPMKGYVPDANMMAFASSRHILYFVTPDLKVMSVSTDGLHIDTQIVINTPANLSGKNLHGYTKLAYDARTDHIFWSTLVQSGNYHSWNSVFGVYKKDSINNNYTNIYYEFQNGSDPVVGFWEIIQSYTFNPINDDFYISRKKKVDVMRIMNDTVIRYKRIPETAGRIGKMIAVNDAVIKYLLLFPAKLPYNLYEGDTLDEQIYWINTASGLYNQIDSIIAPSKMVVDALYQPDRNHIITCFSRDTNYYQLDSSDMDMAFYNYNSVGNDFEVIQTLNTQAADEVDTSYNLNINRPLKLLEKADGKIFLSKKNEIVEISYTGTTYTANSKYYAKGSYFSKGVAAGDNTFVINSVNAGLEFFHTSLGHGSRRTAYPAFNIVHNPINRKIYFFNRLSTENTGFYIYNLDNGQVETFVETPRSIGDLVYSPVQNHILVSEFSKNEGATEGVRVYEGDSGAFVQSLTFNSTNYFGRMFVAPNNKIYISANMKTDNKPAKLLELTADDYTLEMAIAIGQSENPNICYILRSHFCYNPYNNKLYATFAPYVHRKPPYQTSFNGSSANIGDITLPLPDTNNLMGRLLSIDGSNTMVVIDTTILNAGELICSIPDSISGKSSYLGTVFINGTQLHTLDCKTGIVTRQLGISEIVDMDYSPKTNCLYAYSHHHIRQEGLDTNKMKVYKIREDGSFNTIWESDGIGGSVSYNKYDGQVYFYFRTDKQMLGGNPAKVISLNAFADSNAQTGSVSLPTYSFMTEVVPQTNSVFFDPYGKAFFPNGTHSSVSVVNFAGGNEPLSLTPGPNWISIPRLENNATTNYLEHDTIPDVFGLDRFAIEYTSLELEYSNVVTTPATPYIAGWDSLSSEWHFDPENSDNQNAFSYRGYILELLPDGNNTLYMKGQIKDPATTFPLYKDKKNWIGYFLVQEQDVFDALADHIDSITEIWHRNYYCYRPNGNEIIFGPEGGGVYPPGGPEWACTNSQHTIKYGEMIKVHPVGDLTGEDAFYWSTGSNEPPRESRSDPTYYSYTETASYKPIVIELDTTQNPEEIGAFVNDTCVGACSVIEADTAVILMAYLDGRSADSIVFQEYSSAKSSGRKTITSYLVLNEERGLFEKRSISTREGNERVLVSFKKRKLINREKPGLDFKLWPNPASDRLFYSFTLDEGNFVSITLFDITGKLMAEPLHDLMQAGSIRGEILLKAFSGEKLKPGIYLVKLRAGQWLEMKKVIVK